MTAIAAPYKAAATTGTAGTATSAGTASGTSGNAAAGTTKSSKAWSLYAVGRGQVIALFGLISVLVLL
jgi:hypothetical protein